MSCFALFSDTVFDGYVHDGNRTDSRRTVDVFENKDNRQSWIESTGIWLIINDDI
jgi:hypothetical protein